MRASVTVFSYFPGVTRRHGTRVIHGPPATATPTGDPARSPPLRHDRVSQPPAHSAPARPAPQEVAMSHAADPALVGAAAPAQEALVPPALRPGPDRHRDRHLRRLALARPRRGDAAHRHHLHRRDEDAHRPDRLPDHHRRHRQRRRPQEGRDDRPQGPDLLPDRHDHRDDHRPGGDQRLPARRRRARRPGHHRDQRHRPAVHPDRRDPRVVGVPHPPVPESFFGAVRRGRHPADHLPRRDLRDRAQARRQDRRTHRRRRQAVHRGRVQGPRHRHEGRPARRVRRDGLRDRQVRPVHADQPRLAHRCCSTSPRCCSWSSCSAASSPPTSG